MKGKTSIRILSLLFISILFVKTLITAAPFVVSHFDAKTMKEVILQVETENNSKASEISKESSVKEFYHSASRFNFSRPFILLSKFSIQRKTRLFPGFYPAIPTPPPNA